MVRSVCLETRDGGFFFQLTMCILLQAKPTPKDIEALATTLGVDHARFTAEHGEAWWPQRGALGSMPPTDPVIYRYVIRLHHIYLFLIVFCL